jgi:hypothetical protein
MTGTRSSAGSAHDWVWNQRCPSRSQWILIVWICAESLEELVVLCDAVAIELDTQTRRVRHRDRAVAICELSALDYIIHEMVVMRIGGERQVRHYRAQVKHRRELAAELARRMNRLR